MEWLLQVGADIGARNNEGKTPVDLAREGNNVEIMQWLEDNSAKVAKVVDAGIATAIINDLRGLKGAALMFFADNNVWPTTADGASLNAYMDRPHPEDKYGKIKIVPPVNDRGFIGFALVGNTVNTPGVKNEIKIRAAESGVFDDKGETYSGGDEVYISMR